MLKNYLFEHIDEEIAKAENGAESNSNAMYLATLYYLKKCMAETPKTEYKATEPKITAFGNEPKDDDFIILVKSKNIDSVLNVMAEYFEVLKLTNPNAYREVMAKIRQL